MKFITNKNKFKLTISIIVMMLGIYLISYSYLATKKIEIYDQMNELYYENYVHVSEDAEIIADVTVEEKTNTSPKVASVDYTKHYIGYLSIPKIDFKKGFTDKNNKFNHVNRNIEVIKESDMPDKDKGNLIIAGHSGQGPIAFFKDLYKLKLNDEAFITYENKEYKYVIKDIYYEEKDGTIKLVRNKNKNTLTLVTCTKDNSTKQTVYILELEQ